MTFNTQPFEFQQDNPIDGEEEYLVAEVDSATKVTEQHVENIAVVDGVPGVIFIG